MSTKPATTIVAAPANTAVPRHLGIIMDGNRRWATDRGLPKMEGHRHGYETLKKIGEAALQRNVQYLTVYSFSTENWQRAKEEVAFLMNFAYWVVTEEIEEFHNKNMRIVFMGSDDKVSPKILKAIRAAEAKTAGNTAGTIVLCFNYGGQQEIADAAARMMADGVQSDMVTPELVGKYMYHPEIPPIDLVIRTSGEQRLSNFMTWRTVYSELLFVDKHWPDFNEADLDAALAEFASRGRRFGN